MVGYIPDPKKSFLDYLDDPKHNAYRKPIGLFKMIYGLITLIIIPLSLLVYMIWCLLLDVLCSQPSHKCARMSYVTHSEQWHRGSKIFFIGEINIFVRKTIINFNSLVHSVHPAQVNKHSHFDGTYCPQALG